MKEERERERKGEAGDARNCRCCWKAHFPICLSVGRRLQRLGFRPKAKAQTDTITDGYHPK